MPALGIVLALALASAPAAAQPSMAPEAPVMPAPGWHVSTERYGFAVAGVDAAGLALSVATKNGSFVAASYLFGGPVVHLFQGNFKSALGSFGLRTGLVLGGMLVGGALDECGYSEGPGCNVEGLLIGALAGAGTALALDWFWLSEKTTRVYVKPPALLHAGSLRANPELQMSQTGDMMLGLRGSF